MPSLNEKLKSLQGYSKQLGLKYHPDNHFGNPKQTFTGFNTDFTYYNNNSGMAFTRSVNSTLSNLNYMRYGGTINRQERYTDYDLMDAHSIISNALDIISDDIVSQDFNHEIINIKTENEDIKLALEDLFYNILDIDYNLWYWARNMLKYGDCYVLTYQEENKGIIDSISLPVNYVDRHEKIEQDGSYNIYFTFMGSRERIQNYQMMDFRIIGDERFYPFGKSILEPIRRTWKQLRLLEDSMLTYRVARAPERRVFYIEIGNMDNQSALSYINTIRSQLNTQPIIDANGEIDLRYSPNPIWKNSPIPLLDGRVLTIEELSKEYEQGKTNWVYSIDDDTHELLPGKITWCGKNKNTDDHLLKIWLDDNTYQIYDPSHPLIRRDGNKVLAKDLVIGDSMMPFYKGKTNTGYEMVYDPNEGSYRCTHRFVAESSLNEEKNNIFESMDKERNKNQVVVHHKDFNKYNNRPDNLKWMGFRDHFDYHSKLGIENKKYFIAWKETKEGKKKLSDTAKKTCLYTIVPYMKSEKGKLHGKKYGSTTGKQALIKYSKSEKGRQKASEKSKKWNVLLNKGKRLANSYNGTDLHKKHNEIRSKAFKNTWNTKRDYIIEKITLHYNDMSLQIIKEEIKKLNKWISVRKLASLLKENSTFITHLISLNPNYSRNIFKAIHTGAVRKIIKYGGYIDYKQLFIEIHPDISVRYFGGKKNHRIIRIESVPIDDVYCMNIVGPNNEQNRHNFAILGFNSDNSINLKSGLFIKNSLLDDFFVPTRGGNPTNKIERLEGSDNSNAIEDINFILKELFGGLKVPKAYLNYEDGISSRTMLASEDVRYSRTIQRYQKMLTNELYKVAYMHLLLLGFEEGELEEFSINLFNPSQVATMQKLEVLDKQMDVAGKMKDFFSEEYIYKNVFNMTDLDIKEERIKKVNEYKFEMLKKVLDSINITDIEGSLSSIATFNFDYDKLFGNSVSETAVEKIDNENTKDEEEQLDDTEGGEKKEPSKKKKVVPGMGKPELKPEKPTEKPGTETGKTVKDMTKLGDSVKFNKKTLKKYLNEKDVERGIQVHSTNKRTMIKLLNKKLHELAKDDFKLDLSEHQNQEDITIIDN